MIMITVAGRKVGMLGLETVFARFKAAGRMLTDELGAELVELAGRQNYIAPSVSGEYAEALLIEYRRHLGEDVPEDLSSVLSIKILGPGCPRCENLAANVRSALAELGIAADVEHVRDAVRIGEYGVLGTPALIVNGRTRSVGKALTKDQIVRFLSKSEQDA